MKDNTFYFSHDYNARNDRKMIKLRQKFKLEGVGAYWSLIEIMYEEGGKIDLSDLPIIATELRVKTQVLEQVVKSFDLFQNDEKYFWSESVKRRLDKRLEKSKKASESASHRWKNANGVRPHSDSNAIKESKGKESKGNIYTPPTLDEVIKYFTENGYSETSAQKAFKYYNDNNWFDSKGKKVIGWKQKMVGNWFNEENKSKINGSTKRGFVA